MFASFDFDVIRRSLGYLFLDEPPDEKLGIPDFRTVGDSPIDRPSPNLLETLQGMKRRQVWMRDYLIEEGQITAPIKGATLIGNGPDVLTRVSMVGNDLKLELGGTLPAVPVKDKGGYGTNVPIERIAAHWVAVAAVVLLLLALTREIAGRRAAGQPRAAAPAPARPAPPHTAPPAPPPHRTAARTSPR